MAKKVRRKPAAKAKAGRAKAKTRIKARAKPKARTKPKARAKTRAKAAAKRSPRRTAPPKAQSGIIATVTNAFHTVTESIKETARLRNKMERPGESETG
jgi:hypothetical protein